MITNEQIKQNRIDWIEALESGDYTKGKMYLRDTDDNYCCLGVACQLFLDSPVVIKSKYNCIAYSYCCDTEANICMAPVMVVEALGLHTDLGSSLDGSQELSSINDNSDSFAPVITAIKSGKYWKDLS